MEKRWEIISSRSNCCSPDAVQLAEALDAAAALVQAVLCPAAHTLALGGSFTVCGIEGGHGGPWVPRKGTAEGSLGAIWGGTSLPEKNAMNEKY
jgi:hypothetical protein